MVPRWRFLATFFVSCICSEPRAASRVQHISDLHSKCAMCRSMVDIQSVAAEISQGKKIEDRKKPQGKNIMACPIIYTAAIINTKKLKPAMFSCFLRHPTWKRRRPILIMALQNLSLTYLHTYPFTYSPGTYTGQSLQLPAGFTGKLTTVSYNAVSPQYSSNRVSHHHWSTACCVHLFFKYTCYFTQQTQSYFGLSWVP